MGGVRIWLVTVGLLVAMAPVAAFAGAPAPGTITAAAVDPDDGPDPGPLDGADPGYAAGDSMYDTADPLYDAVAWPEPEPAGPVSDPAAPAPDPAGPAAPAPDPAAKGCSAGTVALTFDDGPGPYTAQVLDLLARNRVRATFFVVGEQVQARPGLIRRIVAGGHRVQNHTWSHPNLTILSPARVRAQLTRTTAAITAAGAPKPTQVRPPYGAVNGAVLRAMTAQGLTPIRWTIDTNDWRGRSAAQIRNTVLDRLQPGAVVLMHDGLPSARTMIRALPGMIAGIRAEGYCFGFPRARSAAAH
jgi:peptidoglycan/xylan/chitin deacetylase (PgdA/CDA1 family)